MKYCPRLTVAVLPACTVCAGMLPLGCGARLGTVTRKLCVAVSPPGSRAVTVTVAVPALTPVTVSVPEETDTLATLDADVDAEKRQRLPVRVREVLSQAHRRGAPRLHRLRRNAAPRLRRPAGHRNPKTLCRRESPRIPRRNPHLRRARADPP